MTVMVKRWYRVRRYQFIFFIVVVCGLLYYAGFHESMDRISNLDVTRSTTLTPARSTVMSTTIHSNVASLRYIPEPSDFGISLPNDSKNIYVTSDMFSCRRKCVQDRNSVIEYIENRLQEALKEDKGSGCELPQLDPFAKEVTQFDKELPNIICNGKDWVKCYLSECKVVPDILATTEDIVCSYTDIIYKSDKEYVLGPPVDVEGENVYVLKNSDHVKITCVGKHQNSLLPSKWKGHSLGFRTTVERKSPPPGRENSINVLIFGFDSTSKNGFIRRMPKSYKFLTEELHAVVLDGYNIVGDGTPAALFPILAGKNELELPDVRKKKKNEGTLDSMPFIFYKLKEDGYRTAYFEDMPWIGTFQYRFNGFLKQPADHYLRDFYLEESSSGKKWWGHGTSKYCVGETPQYRLMMNITEQFFKLDGKRFCFTFIADITHDDFNMISTADTDTAQFLKQFRDQGLIEDTLLIVMGDHGPRYAKIRDTLQGKLEERLPLMAIIPPTSLLRSRPHILSALKENVHTLTTPHDIHATILDAMDLTQYYNPYKVKGADIKRGLTLFEPISKNRSCSEAGIEPHWCVCLKWVNIPDTDPMYQRAADALVHFINSLTEPQRSECTPRTLTSVSWVMRARTNQRLLSFTGARDADGYVGRFGPPLLVDHENWQIKIVVGPGRGVYEASMTYLKKEDKFIFDTRDISRTNAYNDEPSCISATHPHLNMYCYCND